MSKDTGLIKYRLDRALVTLAEAQVMADSDYWNACVNRLYYACFYAVTALLLTKQLSSSKHTGVRGLFSLHFVKTGIIPKDMAHLYNTLFDARQESDYEDFFTVEKEDAKIWLEQAKEFVALLQNTIDVEA